MAIAVFGLAASIVYLVNAPEREAIDVALESHSVPRSKVGVLTVCMRGDVEDWSAYCLIAPERVWCYGPRYLTAFRDRAAGAKISSDDTALQRYIRPVLMWNDIAFAVLTGAFAGLADIGISSVVPNDTGQLIFGILAIFGLVYGAVDVMEDFVLVRILRSSSVITADQAAAARMLTRLKMLTITISLCGLALFLALGIIRSVYRRFAQ
ncbi:MAG: hypothetical protein U1E61_08900 [Bradyrhizobium sp.]